MSKNVNRHFSKTRHTDGQRVNEKVFKVTNRQGNANQNHDEMSSPQACQNGSRHKGTR